MQLAMHSNQIKCSHCLDFWRRLVQRYKAMKCNWLKGNYCYTNRMNFPIWCKRLGIKVLNINNSRCCTGENVDTGICSKIKLNRESCFTKSWFCLTSDCWYYWKTNGRFVEDENGQYSEVDMRSTIYSVGFAFGRKQWMAEVKLGQSER